MTIYALYRASRDLPVSTILRYGFLAFAVCLGAATVLVCAGAFFLIWCVAYAAFA
jgi:hypothetical protein